MQDADVEACVELWLDAVRARDRREPPDGTAERARGKFALPRVSWRMERADERLRGFALVTAPGTGNPADPPDAGYLGLLGVAPQHEGSGVGRRLLAAVTADARAAGVPELVLHVLTDNERAARLYRAAGWRAWGPERPHPLSGAPFQTYRLALI